MIDSGRDLGIISQPDRVTFDQLATMTADDRSAFAIQVILPLEAHGDALDGFAARFAALDLPDSRWVREVRDGLDIDRTRVRFVAHAYRAVIAHLTGDNVTAASERGLAADELAVATAVIAARHADLHDTHHDRLFARTLNQTSYGYGYLFFANSACYWNRELSQVDGALGNADLVPPDCFL